MVFFGIGLAFTVLGERAMEGSSFILPFVWSLSPRAASLRGWPLRRLVSRVIPSSYTRPKRLRLAMVALQNMGTLGSLAGMPSRWASTFKVSMILAISMSCGQRVEQVSQAAHTQMVLELRTRSAFP